METTSGSLLWTIVIGSAIGLILAVTLVSIVIFSQRRYRAVQRQKLEAVERSEEKYRGIFNLAPIGIYQSTVEGRFLSANNALVEMLGYASTEELLRCDLGKDIYLDEGDRRRIVAQYQSNKPPRDVEVQWKKKDGPLVWVQLNAHAIKDSSGNVRYFEGFVFDIGDRKGAEEALRESEVRFRRFSESALEGIVIHDKGLILDANPTFASMFGYEAAEVVGKYVLDFAAPESREVVRNHILERKEEPYEGVGLKKDGSTFFVEVCAKNVPYLGRDARVTVIRDVTERKLASEALRKNEVRYRAFISQSSEGIWRFELERPVPIDLPEDEQLEWFYRYGYLAECNDAMARMYGLDSSEEIAGVRLENLLLRSRVENITMLRTFIRSGYRVVDGESQEVDVNGNSRWFINNFIGIVENGCLLRAWGTQREITERKRSEEALRRSEEKYRKFFEEDLSGIFISTPDGRMIDCNPRFAEILGYSSVSEALAFNAYGMYDHPSERDKYITLLKRKGKLYNYERALVRKDGKRIQVIANVIGDFHEKGELLRIRGYLFDVTERQEAEERYRRLFEESKDVIFISTPEGRLVDINPAAVDLFGYSSEEEMLNLDIARDMYWNPRDRENYAKAMGRHGYVKDFELELKRKDGQKLVVLETTTAVRDTRGKIVAYRGIMRDITAQKKLEDQLRQAQKMESIGTLAGGIAHDFNNILGIILAHVSTLERIRENGDRFERSVEALHHAVERGAALVRQLLTFARKTEVQFESVNVNTVVEDIVKIVGETFPRTVAVSMDLGKDVPSIVADHNQLHQVLLNLCVNARDAILESPSGDIRAASGRAPGGMLSIRTDHVLGETVRGRFPDALMDKYACIAVNDTGVGMDEATRARIFEPFFTTKEKGKGTGLGLSVVYGVMNGHQGFIDVESELGKGTTFWLYFPVSHRVLKETEARPLVVGEVPGGSETLLVVEDEEMLRDLVKSLLEDRGYKVLAAKDGQEAVDVYRRHKDEISLVLSDMGLPRIGGWEAFSQMKEINPNVKAILASGYLDPNVRSEILKAGAKDFIQKPYDINEILRRIRQVIDSTVPAA